MSSRKPEQRAGGAADDRTDMPEADLEAKAQFIKARNNYFEKRAETYFRDLERLGEDIHASFSDHGGTVSFYSHAFYRYLDEVGDNPIAKKIFRDVAEQRSKQAGSNNTRIGELVSAFARRYREQTDTAANISRTTAQAIAGQRAQGSTMLYAASRAEPSPEELDEMSRISVRLEYKK